MDKNIRLFLDGLMTGLGLMTLITVAAAGSTGALFAPVYPFWLPLLGAAALLAGIADAFHQLRNAGGAS